MLVDIEQLSLEQHPLIVLSPHQGIWDVKIAASVILFRFRPTNFVLALRQDVVQIFLTR